MVAIRRLTAILVADVAGYSRLMGADEEGTHERLRRHLRDLVDPKVKEHRGRVVKNTGDGLLAEFASVVDAVRCGVEMQRAMADRNADVAEDKRIAFRIGINLGDVIAEDGDIYGDGVNVAARLETLAEPGGICISRVVRDQIRDKLFYPFEDKGEQSVKNIARSVRVFALRPEILTELPPTTVSPPVPRRWIALLPIALVMALVLMIGGIAFWPVTSTPQQQQQNALWDAVIAGDVAKAMLAIRAGAGVNGLDTRPVAGPNGRRPLNWAAQRNDTAMIVALLDAGANIDAANLSGFTPLHHAAESGSVEAARVLIAHRANITLRNRYEQTPEQTALAWRHREIAEMLAQARLKPP